MLLKFYQKIDEAITYLFSSVSNEKKFLKKIFGNKKIIYIDIGANEGGFLDFLDSIFKFEKIIVFEPIDKLLEKIKSKYFNNKNKFYNLALSNKKSIRKFYEYSISSQSSLYVQNDMFKSLKNLKKISKIKTSTFDEIVNEKKKIDFCKIDVQGEEVNVLKGMRKNLERKKIKLLKIELSFMQRYKQSNKNFNEIVNLLKKNGYDLISISKIKYKDEKILLMDAYFLS